MRAVEGGWYKRVCRHGVETLHTIGIVTPQSQPKSREIIITGLHPPIRLFKGNVKNYDNNCGTTQMTNQQGGVMLILNFGKL